MRHSRGGYVDGGSMGEVSLFLKKTDAYDDKGGDKMGTD